MGWACCLLSRVLLSAGCYVELGLVHGADSSVLVVEGVLGVLSAGPAVCGQGCCSAPGVL